MCFSQKYHFWNTNFLIALHKWFGKIDSTIRARVRRQWEKSLIIAENIYLRAIGCDKNALLFEMIAAKGNSNNTCHSKGVRQCHQITHGRRSGSTKVSRDIFWPFWTIISRYELLIAKKKVVWWGGVPVLPNDTWGGRSKIGQKMCRVLFEWPPGAAWVLINFEV